MNRHDHGYDKPLTVEEHKEQLDEIRNDELGMIADDMLHDLYVLMYPRPDSQRC